tara:strand:- start:464 stop:646 length:183 start_codon:yes stop_codon:yes gene_type:complete
LQSEKLSRLTKECNDLELLQEIAHELLKLNNTKSSVSNWATRRAADAEFLLLQKNQKLKN